MAQGFPAPRAPIALSEGLPLLTSIGAELQAVSGLKVCGAVAAIAENATGWQAIAGRYAGPDDEYVTNYPDDTVHHCWSVLPDGTIVDATANQFSPGEKMPRIIPPEDPRQSWYLVKTDSGLRSGWFDAHPAIRGYAHWDVACSLTGAPV